MPAPTSHHLLFLVTSTKVDKIGVHSPPCAVMSNRPMPWATILPWPNDVIVGDDLDLQYSNCETSNTVPPWSSVKWRNSYASSDLHSQIQDSWPETSDDTARIVRAARLAVRSPLNACKR